MPMINRWILWSIVSIVASLRTPHMCLFDSVDPSIARVLECPLSSTPTFFLSNEKIEFPETATIHDLIGLAYECDTKIFQDETNLDAYSLSLAHFAFDNDAMIPTLLALNDLESTIRRVTSHKQGKAPLLKDMIAQLPCLERACRLLLTPEGLNLRNLLWHGFVTELPRPWLSLVLILTLQLKSKEKGQASEPLDVTPLDLGSVPDFAHLLKTTQIDLLDRPPSLMRDSTPWLPPCHHALYQKVIPWIEKKQRPVTCCALLSILLEHGLRLDWCHTNQRPDDQIARPNVFYVTLDGHGQRQLHDLILYPFVGNARNALYEVLPPSTLALLTDLFCSSCGGPNLRAALSHGVWDDWLVQEWTSEEDQTTLFWDAVRLLLLAMDSVSSKIPISYHPVFSYTAVTRQRLNDSQHYLQELIQLPEMHPLYAKYSPMAQSLLGSIPNVPNELLALQEDFVFLQINISLLQRKKTKWTVGDVFEEHELNLQLSKMGLVLSLLKDVAIASQDLHRQVLDALEQMPLTNTRTQKTNMRLIYSSCRMALHLYILARNVALLSLLEQENDETLHKALQRSRMVVSTTQTLLRSKVDRARNSIVEFAKGKAIRQVATRIRVRVHSLPANETAIIYFE